MVDNALEKKFLFSTKGHTVVSVRLASKDRHAKSKHSVT